MEIRSQSHGIAPIVAAVFALIILGLGSLYLTWQSIQHQRKVAQEHVLLSGTVISKGLEGNLIRLLRRLPPQPDMYARNINIFKDYFNDISESKEINFFCLYDAQGECLVASANALEQLPNDFPNIAQQTIGLSGRWHEMTNFESQSVLILAMPLHPRIAEMLGLVSIPKNAHNFPPCTPEIKPHKRFKGSVPLLVVGLNAEDSFAQFKLFRKAALLQTGYVFGAAILLWLLIFASLKRRGQSQRMSELQHFQSKLLDNMPDGLLTVNQQGEILAANPSAIRLLAPESLDATNTQKSPLLGRNWSEFPFNALGQDLKWQQYEYAGYCLEILSVPFQFPEGKHAGSAESHMILLRDRTKIRSLEEDLKEAERLATIGSLAAGIAHEVRNPLSSLRGFAQFFADKFTGQKPYADYATTMVREADRLNRVVTDLLYLAKPRQLSIQDISLQHTVDNLKRLLRFDLENKNIEFTIDLHTETIQADADGLAQVLLNLVLNALDAAPYENGCIRVTAKQQPDGVSLFVEDNGSGMDEAQKKQAMEPFFSTKGNGTGLGLAIVNTMLRAHHGRVTFETSTLGGLCVSLFFPKQ